MTPAIAAIEIDGRTVVACVNLLFWLIIGGAIGSFLNVVVYRLPRGKSLVHPGSSCPACGHLIRARDNVPVLSWLWLRGQCRDCGTPIARRYPLVELTVAVLFVGLALIELFTGGANLPRWSPDRNATLFGIGWQRSPVLGIYLYHCWLLCSLLSIALIEWDGFPPPRRLVIPTLAIGLLAPLLQPTLRPIHALASVSPVQSPLAVAAIDGLAGLLTSLLIGVILQFLARPIERATLKLPVSRSYLAILRADRLPMVVALTLTGTFLGWQAAVLVGSVSSLLLLIVPMFLRRRLPSSAIVLVATLLQIVFWRPLADLVPGM